MEGGLFTLKAMDIKKQVSKMIRHVMDERELTKDEVANLTGARSGTEVNTWLSGHFDGRVSRLFEICDALWYNVKIEINKK